MASDAEHWDSVYSGKSPDTVSWFEAAPTLSLELIARHGRRGGSVLDVGGGASRLVDALLIDPGRDVTVLDLASSALNLSKARLGKDAERASWVAADIATWQPRRTFDVWHDRAVFHFLNSRDEQAAYAATAAAVLAAGGIAIIGTFAPDGPEKCSGLPVTRHDVGSLGAILGPAFRIREAIRHDHITPGGAVQRFQFGVFERNDAH